MRSAPSGETELIRLIQRTVEARGHVKVGIGDDACVLKDGTVATTDAYAEGVHFDLSYMTLPQVGFRCTCAALSDVVAMGARPEVLLVALALPRRMCSNDTRRLYQGIERACAGLGCEVAGGDIIAADKLLLALTALGRTDRPLLRSAARAADSLYVTGFLGSAEAGRLCLKRRMKSPRFGRLVERHLKPVPRLRTVLSLHRRINALIDTSDGIATDARHLTEESRVRIVLRPDLFPILQETKELCKRLHLDPVRFALCSGEDYELLFTSRGRIPQAVAGVPVTRIGRVEKGSGLYIERAGKPVPVRLSGYDHLAGPQRKRCSQGVDNHVDNDLRGTSLTRPD